MPGAGERVLITGDAHYGVLAAVRGLRAGGYAPWVAVTDRGVYAARTRARAGIVDVPSPELEPEEFVAALTRATGEIGAVAVLPGSESALVVLAGRQADFPAGVQLGAGERAAVERAIRKDTLASLAAAAGLETPPTYELDADVALPAIVKPASSMVAGAEGTMRRGWARRVETRAELRRALDSVPAGERWVAQPFLEGRLYSLSGVSWDGGLLAPVHAVARRIWPPHSGGSSFAVTIAPDRDLERRAEQLLQELGWNGIFQLQLIESHGAFFLIDVNLRVYGSLALAIAAGVNLPAIWVDLLLGRDPQIEPYREDVSFRAPEKDVRALWRELRQGRGGEAIAGLRPARPGVQSVFSLRDPLPILAAVGKIPALFRRRG